MKKENNTNFDFIKAMRRGGREAEMELLGPGFHSKDKIHKSKKSYTRKIKHKKDRHDGLSFFGIRIVKKVLFNCWN